MKTRHSKGMLDSSEATPRSPPGHNLEMDLDTDMASGTEEQAVSTVNQLDIATTQAKDSKKAKKRTARDSSMKRTRKTPFDRIQLSYAASLPPIVWIFDTQYQWWPGKVSIRKLALAASITCLFLFSFVRLIDPRLFS